MFCCAGLLGGFIAGAATGIPWMPFVTAAAGAGSGLLIDIKMFRALNKKNESKESQPDVLRRVETGQEKKKKPAATEAS